LQDYERKAISEVIEEINKRYFLPDIQRDFVWKPEQVYTVFDSIMRDYPISTFLFWKQDGGYLEAEAIKKLEFVRTSQEKNRENTEVDSSKEYLLVLDGQQRLTTFYLVLKGNYIMRNKPYDLYFNILSGKDEQEDGILYEFKFFNKEKGTSFTEENGEAKKLWYRVKDIYDIGIGQMFGEINKISEEIKRNFELHLMDNHKNNIAKLCQYLKAEKIIYYYPEVEKDYDKVLDIFVRTNAGGTKLSYSDLLFSTIKSKWHEARNRFDSLLTKINDNDRYAFSNDFVLKALLVLYAENNEGIRYKAKNFRPALIGRIQSDWEKIDQAISLSVDLIKDKLFLASDKTIASYNSIIPIIYFIFKNDLKGFGAEKNCLNDDEISKMRVWLIKALFSGIFGGQSDTILYKCKEAIDSNSQSFPAADIERRINNETKKSMKTDLGFLDGVSYNSKDSYLALSICYDGAINFQPRFKGNLPEQDHIFSRDELRRAGVAQEKIDSIYNIRYIGSNENKIKSNTPFSEWLGSIGRIGRKKHHIPEGAWSTQNFDDFLIARKGLVEAAFQYGISPEDAKGL